MFGKRMRLFRVAGLDVRVDASWIFLAFLITWSLAEGLFPAMLPGLLPSRYWVMGIVGALGLFGSILLHEISHSLVAGAYGTPVKGITLFIFGGVAEASEEPSSPREEFLMAAAGPLMSVLLGLCFYGLSRLGQANDWSPIGVAILDYLGSINFILAIFNLIPGFPLDGGRILRSILWAAKKDLHGATRIASTSGSVFGVILMVLGGVSFLGGNFIGGMWWFLIGMFLKNAAKMSYRSLLVKEGLEGVTIERFINRRPVTVAPELTLDQLVESFVYRHHFKMFPVTRPDPAGDELLGCVTVDALRRVPREAWPTTRVESITTRPGPENTVTSGTKAETALNQMVRTGFTRMMVADGTHLVGMVTLRDLLEFLSLKLDLENVMPEAA